MRYTILPAAILLAGGIAQTFAAGILIYDQDAFASARGEAFAATADNASAVYYNPAGIRQATTNEFRVGIYAITYQTKYESPAGIAVDSKRAYEATPNAYFVTPIADSDFSVGVGLYTPFGLSMRWPEATPFRSIGIDARVEYFTVEPVVAWQPLPQLSIGAGPTFSYATTDLKQGLSPFAGNDSFRFKGDGFSLGASAGIRWQPWNKHSFGLVYRSPNQIDFSGNTDTQAKAPTSFNISQSAKAKFDFPQQVVCAYSYRPTECWNLEFDATWTDWSSFGTIPIRQSTAVPPIILNWNSSWHFAWGATRQLNGGWHVSGGYIFSENSAPDAHYNPLVPDTDRHAWSLGVGRSVGRWSWDLGYQLTWGTPRTVSGSAPSLAGQTADGRYEWWSHALSATLGLKF